MVNTTEITKELATVTADDVKKYICANATDTEIGLFLNIAKVNGLNPFKREIYLVKYGTSPASILTGYEVYLKRAERTNKYAGFSVRFEGTIPDMKAIIEINRKDWTKPLIHEVDYSEYVQKKADGTITRFWKDKPKTMLRKVAISQGMRLAFPGEIAGMPYTQEEVGEIIADKVVDVLPQPKKKVTEIVEQVSALCSKEQQKEIISLASKKYTKSAFEKKLKEQFGSDKLQDLTSENALFLIEELKCA